VADSGTEVKHLTSQVVTLQSSFFLQFRAEKDRENASHFQPWNIWGCGQMQYPEDMLLVNLNLSQIKTAVPLYASAPKAWITVKSQPHHKLTTVDEFCQVPLWHSVLFNPHSSGNILMFDIL
jgi:hypothetical protein